MNSQQLDEFINNLINVEMINILEELKESEKLSKKLGLNWIPETFNDYEIFMCRLERRATERIQKTCKFF